MAWPPGARERLSALKDDIVKNQHTPLYIVRRHITYGPSCLLDEDRHFDLRARVGSKFGIHPSEVVLVGSGKLGFSVKPSRRFEPFGEASDLDLALVSQHLFNRYWQEAYAFEANGGTWERVSEFKDFLFRGWIRPDMLPTSASFKMSNEWFEYFRDLTSKRLYGNYKITAGIYRSWFFLEEFQQVAIRACQRVLLGESA